ncbi:UNVERIFIED_CONTAM: Sugar transport protein 8 [Sesamum radiatum]|uniref:Sugar transport protein 8 n=1 Tax=Sesamum radiatum TaxID=300843 RepID=A0AAW2UE42_SESRA
MLQLFTSSLYIAALVASFFASKACSLLGRRPTILMASLFFIAGSIFCGAANAKWMLIFGRVLFGIGVGFGNEKLHLYTIGERSNPLPALGDSWDPRCQPYKLWNSNDEAWLEGVIGLAAVPGLILFIGSLVITETPPSLVEMGKEMEARAALQKIRGVDNVDAEFQQIVTGCEQAKQVKRPFKKLFKKSGFPALFISTIIQVFQQFTGINAIMFYAPVLFQTLGFKSDASLLSAVITGCNWSNFGNPPEGDRDIGQGAGSYCGGSSLHIRDVVCMVVGPMGWLIPSEIFPIETRTAGFAFAVSTNMIFTFIIAQAFLSMLCHMRAYIFFFFSAWILIMGLFVVFLLPETKGVPIELVEERVWKQHPVWKKFFKDEGKETAD